MKTTQVQGFTVVGRETRTSNAKEMSGTGVIAAMWAKGVPSGWPVVAVYSNYASDKDGDYDYLLGRKLSDDETMPRELAHRTIVTGLYWHLSFEGSISPESVIALWRQVWEAEHIGTVKRAYKTDYEIYGQSAFDLYVGVKA